MARQRAAKHARSEGQGDGSDNEGPKAASKRPTRSTRAAVSKESKQEPASSEDERDREQGGGKEDEDANEDEDEDDDSDEAGPMPMPASAPSAVRMTAAKKRRKLAFEGEYLKNLPSAAMYERSYMHRDVVTHVLVAPETQFIITASRDGHVKFWKKMARGIEFVKHYKAHLGEIVGLAVSRDGLRLCSTSTDQNLKFYDVVGFDMVHMLAVKYVPSECCWIHQRGAIDARIVVADRDSALLRVYRADQVDADTPLHVLAKAHTAPVTVLGFNAVANCVISGDQRGHLEYWNADTYATPTVAAGVHAPSSRQISFKFKGETDLYDLAKSKTYATSIDVSARGDRFVVTAQDAQIRVFRFTTGKLQRKIDENLTVFEDAQAEGTLHLDAIDFGRRAAVERELQAAVTASSEPSSSSPSVRGGNCIFDESGHFLMYATLLGIKLVNLETNKLVRVLGKVENSDRFLQLSLFQGKPKVDSQLARQLTGGGGGGSASASAPLIMSDASSDPMATQRALIDPTVFATSFKRNRFFLFSSHEPMEDDENGDGDHVEGTGRDVFNEKPTLEETQVATETSGVSRTLGDTAVLHTTKGDITIKLFPKECPRTITNFCTHAREGYYDNVLFHRVIPNFMVQTGDPMGDGTGGESIWGGEFEDEFHRSLRHDRSFTVSMANAGPNTNGSQFFITTVPTPWLDNKHTVFGRVEHGKDTVSAIEHARTDKYDRPHDEIKIINIDIF